MKEMMNTIKQSVKSDDELTARKLKAKLAGEFPSLPNVSLATIKHCQKELGWVCTRPHYCIVDICLQSYVNARK